MKKSLFIILAFLSVAFSLTAALTADWKIHMPFDAWPTQVIETPGRVYFISRTFQYQSNIPDRATNSNSLFYYDKEGDEIIPVNARLQGSGNAVAKIAYNAAKKYLLVVYTDCNMDFLYEDGRVFNLPALMAASIPGKKEVNSITFDNANNRAYLGTSFGYVALNDDKHEIAESRNYSENIECIARCGNNIVIHRNNGLYHAPLSSQRFNITDYVQIPNAPDVDMIVPLENDDFYAYSSKKGSKLGKFTRTGDTYGWEQLYEDPEMFGIQQIPGGHRLSGNVRIYEIKNNGETGVMTRLQEDYGKPAASYDGTQLWVLTSRKGLRKYTRGQDGWAVAKDHMLPNSPAAYVVTSMAYHPKYGMLAGSNGVDYAFNDFNQMTPNNISALKGGFWKEYGPEYTAPGRITDDTNFFGLAVDPQNSDYVYRSNTLSGLMRLNLSDPSDIMIMANPGSRNAGVDGFVKVVENQNVWNLLCRFATPQFSSDGTMWTIYNNADASSNELWYWTAADRAASTSPATFRMMKKIEVPKFISGNTDVLITLNRNRNMIAMGGSQDGGAMMIYDHNGTPDVTKDDRYAYVRNPYDQDGGSVNFSVVNNLTEDPETGLIWILTQRGPFTVNPATVFDNPNYVNRIKVARNDGTNLADYLLNEINVHHMSIDGEGRKWFSTSSGLVCTSRDGKSILAEFTTDNSYLPSDNVYFTCYNPENNSILVATEGGLAEMFPSGSGGSTTGQASSFRTYPNPVEPDYYGWVRIDNLADGSLVKITDSKGGVVKELGPAQGGSVEWDVSGLNNTRVSTGVYYIMVSPGSEGGNTEIQKILVLN